MRKLLGATFRKKFNFEDMPSRWISINIYSLIFFISKISLNKRLEGCHPCTQKVYHGTPKLNAKITLINPIRQNNKRKQSKTIRWSIKSGKTINGNSPKPFIHSNRVSRNNSFRSWIDFSQPSKVQAFLSCQRPHLRQWGIMLQIFALQHVLNLPL